MQAQAQLSGQAPGQATGQLASVSQNMNSLTLPGGNHRTWQTDSDVGIRRNIVEKILLLFQKREPRVSQEWQQKLPEFVKRLEESLYRDASSKEEYSDLSTVEQRLRAVAKRIMPSRNHPNVAAQGANASGMTPTQRKGKEKLQCSPSFVGTSGNDGHRSSSRSPTERPPSDKKPKSSVGNQDEHVEYWVRRFSHSFEERIYPKYNAKRFFCKLMSCRVLPELQKSFPSKGRINKHLMTKHGEEGVPDIRKGGPSSHIDEGMSRHQAAQALNTYAPTIVPSSVEGTWFFNGYLARAKEQHFYKTVHENNGKRVLERTPRTHVKGVRRVNVVDLCTPEPSSRKKRAKSHTLTRQGKDQEANGGDGDGVFNNGDGDQEVHITKLELPTLKGVEVGADAQIEEAREQVLVGDVPTIDEHGETPVAPRRSTRRRAH